MERLRAVFQKKSDHLVDKLVLDQVIIIQDQAERMISLGEMIDQRGKKGFNFRLRVKTKFVFKSLLNGRVNCG